MPPVSITFSGDTLAEALAAAALACGAQVAAEAAAPAAPKAPVAPRTRKAPEAAPAPAAAPAAAPKPAAPAAAPAADGEAVKKQAIATLVKLINANDALGRNGKQVCTDLCLTFGGANVSKIDPAKYGDLIKATEKALEDLNSDPTA
jgi:hypothetical protein